MDKVSYLINILEKAIPNLNTQILSDNLPETENQDDVLDWLYQSLSSQRLMDYVEWKEYFGEYPDIGLLDTLSLTESPNDFILEELSEVDWNTVSVDPYMLPYELPYLEHLNAFLTKEGLRLVDLANFENAYILCIRDNEEIINKLNEALNAFDMGINERPSMNREQAESYIRSLLV
ncbi:hypothetical protein AB7102_06795 [Providencia manganoxydans]|uniref:hypothetical protein n=1 Tax=Providencia manganoxydans TaxID=2923283 RepID=UPI0034E394A4